MTSLNRRTAILFRQTRFGRGYLEGDAQAGAVPDVDKAFLDDRIRQAFDDVVPPLRLAERVLEGDVVLRQRGGHVHVGGEADEAIEDSVRRDRDAVNVGVFGDPFQFGDAADIFGVGADYVDCLLLDQVLEVLPEVDLFAGVDRDGRRLLELAEEFGIRVRRVVAGEDVFDPGDVQRLAARART